MTHLLHQMVHYRTTLRGSEQSSTTIVRITIHTNATILNIKIKSSESCAMRYLLRVTQSTGKAGCRTVPYSTSSGTKSGSSSVKIKNGVSTNVLSKSNHTHGGGIKHNIMHRVKQGYDQGLICGKTIVYAVVHLKERIFKASFLCTE